MVVKAWHSCDFVVVTMLDSGGIGLYRVSISAIRLVKIAFVQCARSKRASNLDSARQGVERAGGNRVRSWFQKILFSKKKFLMAAPFSPQIWPAGERNQIEFCSHRTQSSHGSPGAGLGRRVTRRRARTHSEKSFSQKIFLWENSFFIF